MCHSLCALWGQSRVSPAFCNVRPRNARNSRFLDRMAGFYMNDKDCLALRLAYQSGASDISSLPSKLADSSVSESPTTRRVQTSWFKAMSGRQCNKVVKSENIG